MRALVAGLPFAVFGPRDVGVHEAPEETGETFLENAVLKARWYAARTGIVTVADDSGLSVDALRGAPGLYSSRFAGEGASDADRIAQLLERLRGVAAGDRGARFTSAVAVAKGPDVLWHVVETAAGQIAEAPAGEHGFGYDPIFFYPPLGQTFGELRPEQKDLLSHRGKAFAHLRRFLLTLNHGTEAG